MKKKNAKSLNTFPTSKIENSINSTIFGANSHSQTNNPTTPSIYQEEKQTITPRSLPKEETDYRWQWRNPDLAEESNNTNSLSEIKRTLAKKITPELQKRVIEQANAQDKWAKWVEEMGIKGFTKQLALNCAKIKQEDNALYLGARSQVIHLCQHYTIKLQQALQHYLQQDVQLTVEENNTPQLTTPQEQHQKIYDELCLQAKRDLNKDPRLNLFLQEFDAVLEVASIRPV